ncbi:PREDICTED: extracellular calcium-sensing receptor-like [Amphimedon queenslandica]|uniref:Receptor ligand binding region domain-containing protein n=1 Tax=Amphimedon queenslandica TaxID=400682 RepID=A0AAN0J2K4_AMPQE|nr:PREDICTED: extracellular calcium-sensing receptor-like [Amphimedon queenslandica]|eukprot:XP_019850962.1 PREDICTED: extracellular calcium-sensing receptor-like [Amphimedon queenslandica]
MKFIALYVLIISISNVNPEYSYNEESDLLMALDGRISGMKSRMGKDIVIGGLAQVHESENGKCLETILQHHNVEDLEALLYAIDVINSDPNILPNLTLGYDIRDTCGSENVGLDEAIDIIYSNGQIEIESCSAEFDNDTSLTETPVSAVIGAIISPVTISVASLFRLFKMPQISFSSTSPLLNSRESYPYFFRTIPGDDYQVQAMIDLILHLKWDHVSTLYSSNRYGQPAINAFHKLAKEKGICFDYSESLEEKSDYHSIASKLYNSTANVVVLFASLTDVRRILSAVSTVYKNSNNKRRFLWLASDSWSEVDEYYDITIGKWGTAPSSPYVEGFNEYYSQLTPSSNRRNPWFEQSYRLFYKNCTNCTESITDSANYIQHSLDALAIDAVYTIANAFEAFFKKNCDFPIVWYPQNRSCISNNSNYNTLTGENLKDYIQRTNFTSFTQNIINFDSEGNIEGKYKILNYQLNTSTDCNEKCVAIKEVASISQATAKYNYDEESELLMTLDGRISGMKNRIGKDIVIGGLVRVHKSENGKCVDAIIEHKSVENLEALLYAIDVINSDPNILPNLTLGYDIRDTCVSESVALDEAIDIIYSNGQIEIESCSAEFDNDTSLTETPVSAVIGAIISPVTISVASLFRLFKMPQVSFSSTSSILNNREFYPYFFRTIPPDNHQVQAMIDLILHFKWDHVSTLYSSNRYGQPAIDAFHKLAKEKGICLDISESLDEKSDYDSVASKLYNSTANVVVLFASLTEVEKILDAVSTVYNNSNDKRRFLWLASDSWSEIDNYHDITIGKWGTAPSSPVVDGFNEYYSLLTPSSNRRNPWFAQFYQIYNQNCSNNSTTGNCSTGITQNASYSQDSFDALAIDAFGTHKIEAALETIAIIPF